jgi:hypothetical protein
METSICSKCKEEKEISKFGWNKQRDRPNYWCKSCRVAYNNQNDKKHQERVKKSRKKTKLKANYGITLEEYNKQLEHQQGKCAICFEPLDKAHVDHCHDTGTLRGLLCPRCNHGLGHFKDNIEALKQAVEYIKSKGVWN